MRDDLMQQGIDLMIYGMGTVTVFLALLVVATLVVSWVVQTYFPEPDINALSETKAPTGTASMVEPQIYRAIESAIKQHRARH